MYLIVVGWVYVALMMAVAEATNTTGTVLGAVITFVLYGAIPVSLVLYFITRPGRRRAMKLREAAEAAQLAGTGSGEPNRAGKASADAVAPVRKEP
jgi:mannose/fructose/N-acetylgalactosamine-specific phosphotransferase system component IID